MKRRLFFSGCAIGLFTTLRAAPPKLTPWRLDARVFSAKSDRLSKREQYDDRFVRMNFKVEVVNQEFKQRLENATGTLVAFGKHVNQSDELQVMLREEMSFSLNPLEKFSHETQSVQFEYDDKDTAQFGYKYFGYLLVLKNSKGEFLTIKSTPPLLADNIDAALKLTANSYVKRDMRPSKRAN